MTEKLQPPVLLEAAPAVAEVEPVRARDMLPDLAPEVEQELVSRADAWVTSVATLTPKTPEYTAQIRQIQDVARTEISRTASSSSRFLDTSLAQAKSAGGGNQADVSRSLVDLRNLVQDLAPSTGGFFDRLARKLPGGKQVQRYFRQYESNQAQLNSILGALDRGQDGLRKDNAALAVERTGLWNTMGELKKLGALLAALDTSLTGKIADLRAAGRVEEATAMENDMLFAVRQRAVDVQTQLAVSVQAYLSMDLVQDNNLKLVDGVERAKTTTMTALRTAVVVAQALENQRIVLDQIDAVNRTTNDMIARTSEMLRDNTGRVQEQAVNAGVSMETLQKAYDNLFATIDEVENFRAQANMNFATTIGNLNQQLERATPYLERSRQNQEAESGAQLPGGGGVPPLLGS